MTENLTQLTGELARLDALLDGTEPAPAREPFSYPSLALRLPRLAFAYNLTPFERDVVLLCLAPELDPKYEVPTVSLALRLFCSTLEEQVQARAAFTGSASPLPSSILRHEEPSGPLQSRKLQLEPRVTEFLLGDDSLDAALRTPAPVAWWTEAASNPGLVWSARHRELLAALHVPPSTGADWLCLLSGPAGSGRKTFAASVCHARGLPLLLCDLAMLAASHASPERTLASVFREARMYGVPLYLEGWPCAQPVFGAVVRAAVECHPGLVFLAGPDPCQPADFPNRPRLEAEFAVPEECLRRELWMRHVPAPELAAQLAGLFRFLPGQIDEAAARVHSAPPPTPADPTPADWVAACRDLCSRHLVSFAVKIPARRKLQDLVLPKNVLEQLEEMCNQVHHQARVYGDWGFGVRAGMGCGILALFSGPSGTGKTMSAEVISGVLGLDLYKIDLSSLISKYIGETEKHLARVFEDGERSGGILFFDEADAIFGKRSEVKDSHDRYANIETNYLLQRIEDYPGVVILASNMGRNIDPAFQRRMNFVVEFPFPDAGYRHKIWRAVFPPAAPLSDDVDFEFLAEQFPLAGGHIRNIAVSAAFRAAGNGGSIGMHHLLLSLKREYQKMGKVCERSELGRYYHLVR